MNPFKRHLLQVVDVRGRDQVDAHVSRRRTRRSRPPAVDGVGIGKI